MIGKIEQLIRRVAQQEICPHHYHLHSYGDHLELTFHVMLPGSMDIHTGHEIVNQIETALREEMHIMATIHLEPHLNKRES